MPPQRHAPPPARCSVAPSGDADRAHVRPRKTMDRSDRPAAPAHVPHAPLAPFATVRSPSVAPILRHSLLAQSLDAAPPSQLPPCTASAYHPLWREGNPLQLIGSRESMY